MLTSVGLPVGFGKAAPPKPDQKEDPYAALFKGVAATQASDDYFEQHYGIKKSSPFHVDTKQSDNPSVVDRALMFLRIKDGTTKDRKVLAENESAFAIPTYLPEREGHCLIIPKRREASVFNLTDKELTDCFALIKTCKALVEKQLGNPKQSFIIEINYGKPKQDIPHAHFHLIPQAPEVSKTQEVSNQLTTQAAEKQAAEKKA